MLWKLDEKNEISYLKFIFWWIIFFEESVYTSGEIVWNTILIEHELQLAQSFPQLLFSDFFEVFSLWQGFVSLSLQQLSFTDFSLQHFSTFWANAICFGSIWDRGNFYQIYIEETGPKYRLSEVIFPGILSNCMRHMKWSFRRSGKNGENFR